MHACPPIDTCYVQHIIFMQDNDLPNVGILTVGIVLIIVLKALYCTCTNKEQLGVIYSILLCVEFNNALRKH